MRTWLVVALTAALVACGGSGPGAGGGTPADLAATACDAELKDRLDGKLYELDLAALAGSMKDAGNDTKMLSTKVKIEPGLTSEVTQIIECTVRFADGKATPDVVGFGFNW